jgi:hypothetical protein
MEQSGIVQRHPPGSKSQKPRWTLSLWPRRAAPNNVVTPWIEVTKAAKDPLYLSKVFFILIYLLGCVETFHRIPSNTFLYYRFLKYPHAWIGRTHTRLHVSLINCLD